MKKKFVLPTIDHLDEIAGEFLETFPESGVFCFYGSMGAGKTTFIQALCKRLKVVDVVNSPSFAIVNEYSTANSDVVYHFDFYRLKDEEEAFDLGYEDYFYSGSYCFVEWPEKIESLLPQKRYDVTVTVMEDMSRSIEVIHVK